MLTAIIVSTIIVAALLQGLRTGRDGTILRRPYNNRHNDASAARDEAAFELE